MSRPRRRFGPLLYGALLVGAVELIALVGWRLYPSLRVGWEARRVAGRLGDPSKAVRDDACTRLMAIGPPASAAVIDALRDPRDEARLSACAILLMIGPDPEAAVEALARAADDRWDEVRLIAVRQLGKARGEFGPNVPNWPTALAALRRRLRDEAPEVRIAAARALTEFRQTHPSILAEIAGQLDDTAPDVRFGAAALVLHHGPKSEREAALATLHALVASPDPIGIARTQSTFELIHHSPDHAATLISALARGLSSPDRRVRFESLDSLGTLSLSMSPAPRERVREILPVLLLRLTDSDRGVRLAAAHQVARIESKAAPLALPAVLGIAFDSAATRFQGRSAQDWLTKQGYTSPGGWLDRLIAWIPRHDD
jgi:HEAT repeat protein